MLPRNIALILVAAQKAWDDPYWGQRNNPEAEARMADLAQAFRAAGLDVIHVRSDSRDPNSPLHPGEPAIASSKPNWSASVVAYLKASFHSGVM